MVPTARALLLLVSSLVFIAGCGSGGSGGGNGGTTPVSAAERSAALAAVGTMISSLVSDDIPVDASLNIVAGSRQVTNDSTVGMGQATFTLQWPTLSAAPPYDEALPR